jgi:hypothetical protein
MRGLAVEGSLRVFSEWLLERFSVSLAGVALETGWNQQPLHEFELRLLSNLLGSKSDGHQLVGYLQTSNRHSILVPVQ